MKLHAQAALTLNQRREIQRLHKEEKIGIRPLAERFKVNPTTIQRWVGRDSALDKSSAPLNPRTQLTPAYRQAVLAERQAHPGHGPIRIAQALQEEFPRANRGSVLRILQAEGLTRPPQRQRPASKPIPVGHHRVQMDVQQLPAIAGGKGFEYKISMIHLRTRYKYSEICDNMRSETVAAVLQTGLEQLPPFFSSGPTTP